MSPSILVRRAATVLASAIALGAAATAHAHELRVEVRQAQPGAGPVNAALYADEQTWLKRPQQGRREPVAEGATTTVLVWRDLPAGRYALALFQDLNGNGRLDMNPAGMPVEPLGFSRDAAGTMGPPAFADAAVELNGDVTIVVTLR